MNGSLLKTAKSKLAGILESESGNPHVDKIDIPNDSALVVDAMAIVQCLKGNWKTFSDFADSVFEFVIKLAQDCRAKRLDFVADHYPALSIKNTERARHTTQGVQRVHIYGQDQKIPKQWKKFLSSGENKESLLEFFINSFTSATSNVVRILSTTSLCCISGFTRVIWTEMTPFDSSFYDLFSKVNYVCLQCILYDLFAFTHFELRFVYKL